MKVGVGQVKFESHLPYWASCRKSECRALTYQSHLSIISHYSYQNYHLPCFQFQCLGATYSPPKYLKSPRSPASTFPHTIQLLLDCLPSARLVSISPRGDYFCTFAHGKFLASPTRSNSATAVTSCGDSLSRAGKPLGLQMGLLTRLADTRRSNRHSSPLSTVSILLQSLTPERLYVFSPATF